jgi:hypothetical protein
MPDIWRWTSASGISLQASVHRPDNACEEAAVTALGAEGFPWIRDRGWQFHKTVLIAAALPRRVSLKIKDTAQPTAAQPAISCFVAT